jgi:hypothetical protein
MIERREPYWQSPRSLDRYASLAMMAAMDRPKDSAR